MSEQEDRPWKRLIGKWPGDESEAKITEELNRLGKCQKCKKHEGILRWRKWPEEKPEKDGDYFCANSGRCFVAGFANGSWTENYGTDEVLAEVNYWRPIGPLPGGE